MKIIIDIRENFFKMGVVPKPAFTTKKDAEKISTLLKNEVQCSPDLWNRLRNNSSTSELVEELTNLAVFEAKNIDKYNTYITEEGDINCAGLLYSQHVARFKTRALSAISMVEEIKSFKERGYIFYDVVLNTVLEDSAINNDFTERLEKYFDFSGYSKI